MKLKINNATVITNREGNNVLRQAVIQIEGGKIVYAGAEKQAPAFVPERVIDASEKIVMPGFFNLHTHIPMTLFRCYADDMALQEWLFDRIFPAEEQLTDEMAYWASLGALCEFAAAGVVGFNEMYDHCDAIARAVKQSGHRAVIARGIVAFTPQMAEEKLKEALDCYEQYQGDGRLKVFLSPHAQYTNENATLALIAEHAARLKTGIHTHVSETKKEHEECVAHTGHTPVELFSELGLMDVPFIGAHCVWVSDRDIEIMARHKATVASCPRSNLKLASGVAPLQKMIDAGVNVGIGTDSAASNNRLSMMSEMTYASLLQKGTMLDPLALPAAEVIRLATVNGARALDFDSGVIEAGKNADLIMIDTAGIRFSPDYDPVASVVYAAESGDVSLTMVGGDILYEGGQCTFADVDEVKSRLKEYAKAIKK